ncbi:glycosyltransferase family 2 protein [uncultured Nostoc sp.]|uniref:glycosyltransferase family 2 protein n=1 Tax=uncultured Nostoc sp. TaxID=340711 RepID=UPI0035CA6BBA
MSNVSVIIPTYQRANLVSETIESVLVQTYTDYEIIVVNDGSTDNTREVLARFGNRITVIHQENKGPSVARNTGIMASQGQYIAFIDDDDLWVPNKLEKQVSCFESNPNIGLVYSNILFFNDYHVSADIWPKRSHPPGVLKNWMLFELNFIPILSVMVRRECLDEVGLFDQTLKYCEDYDLWLRIIEKFSVHFLNKPLGFYRLSSTNSLSKNKEQILLNEIHIKEKAFSRNPNLTKLPLKLLDQSFYSKYLTLAHFYIHHYQGEKARLVLNKYRQARGIDSIYEWLWQMSFPALNSSPHL